MEQAVRTAPLSGGLTTLLVVIFFTIVIVAVLSTRARWSLLAKPFRTKLKLDHDDYDQQAIQIDGRNFRKLIVIPAEQGLYISHKLLPRLMGQAPVLIPWGVCSPLFTKTRSAIGLSVTEHFLHVQVESNRHEIKIPRKIAEEILTSGFLRSAS